MSASNDRGKVLLDALVLISQMDNAADMQKIAIDALIAIGAIRLMPEEPKVTLQ